jgi:hypothetical protein
MWNRSLFLSWCSWLVVASYAVFASHALFAQPPAEADAQKDVAAADNTAEPAATKPPQRLFSGRVVFLSEALKRRGIPAYDEIKEQVVLETAAGDLIPIVPDWRGRAFFQDARLRDRKVDLVGLKRTGNPYIQVLMVFTFDKHDRRQLMDYWCDTCSIPMYEIKLCECCQEAIRIRFRNQDLPGYLNLDKKQSPTNQTDSLSVDAPRPTKRTKR